MRLSHTWAQSRARPQGSCAPGTESGAQHSYSRREGVDEQPPPPGPGASQRPGGLTPQRAAPAGCGQAEAVKGGSAHVGTAPRGTRRGSGRRSGLFKHRENPSSWALTLLNGREAPCQAAPSRQPGRRLQGTARGLDGGLQRQQDPQEASPEGVTPTHRQSRSLRTPRHGSGRPRVRRSQTSAG